jgi:hypothetical protein
MDNDAFKNAVQFPRDGAFASAFGEQAIEGTPRFSAAFI